MILWRISNYANLDGTGGLVVAGRWHSKGRPGLYCAQSPSTALLEALVHLEIDAEDRPAHFQVLRIEGSDKLSRESLDPRTLPPARPSDLLSTQCIGDKWLSSRRSLLLEVPSVLVPETWNVIANPLHREFSKLRITNVYEHPFDTRFFA